MPGRPSSLCTEQMLMILPRRRAIMCRATAWPTMNTLSRLVRISSCQCSCVKSCKRRAALHAGVVDQDVDRADVGLDARHGRRHGVGVGGVEGAGVHRGTFCAQLRRGGFELGGVAPVQHHGRAGAGQPTCQRQPDAGAGAGDQRGLAAQVELLQCLVHGEPLFAQGCSIAAASALPRWRQPGRVASATVAAGHGGRSTLEAA